MNLLGIEVTQEEFNHFFCEQAKGKEIKVVNNKIVVEDRASTQEELSKQRIAELKAFLLETDYKAIKYAEGLISNEDYYKIKKQRQSWRDEINNIENASLVLRANE